MKKYLFMMIVIAVASLLSAELPVWVDANRFLNEDGNTIVEVNYVVPYNQLDFAQTDQGFVAFLRVDISLERDGKDIHTEGFTNHIIAEDLTQTYNDNVFMDKITLTLSRPDFYIKVRFEDELQEDYVNWVYKVDILPSETMISDLEFSTSIEVDRTRRFEKFHRGDYRFRVNPGNVFRSRQFVYLYYELYNLPIRENGEFIEEITITRKDSLVTERREKIPTESARTNRIKEFMILGYEPGIYELTVSLEDPETGMKTQRSDIFSVARKEERAEKRVFVDLDDEFKLVRYFLSPGRAHQRLWSSLSEDGKRNFLERFWATNDPNPQEETNQFKREVLTRIEYANDHFSSHQDGWETARGRVYIKHGKPQEILKLNTGLMTHYTQKNYEIWKYRATHNATYIFIDIQSNNNHRLIYSQGDDTEATIPDWRDYLGTDFDEGLLN